MIQLFQHARERRTWLALGAAAALPLLLTACGGGGGGSTITEPTQPKIVVSSNFENVGSTTNNHLYLANLDGTSRVQLTSADDYHPSAANGVAVYVSKSVNPWQIFKINLDGTGNAQLTTLPADAFAPAINATGTKAVFAAANTDQTKPANIATINLDGSGLAILPITGTTPTWSPDGTKIAFTNPSDQNKLYIANADGSGSGAAVGVQGDAQDPDWVGTKITYFGTRSGIEGIWIYDTTTKQETQLTTAPVNGTQQRPTLRRDGGQVMFVGPTSGVSPRKVLYTVDAVGGPVGTTFDWGGDVESAAFVRG